MNTVTHGVIDGAEVLICSCGAKALASEGRRFNRRHPKLCSERREYTKKVAQGVRCVDSEDRLDNMAERLLSQGGKGFR